jgi:hypothetical protein
MDRRLLLPGNDDLTITGGCAAFLVHNLRRGLFSVRRAATTASATDVTSSAIAAIAVCPARASGPCSQHDYANANFWIVSFLHQAQCSAILAKPGKVARQGVLVQTWGLGAKPMPR